MSTQLPGRLDVVVERPPDFEAFWAGVLDEVAAIPLDATVVHRPERSDPDVDVYEVTYTSLEHLRIAGWYCVPAGDRFSPPFPGMVVAPGYVSEPTLPKSWARQGYAALGLAPRGKLRSNRHFNPGYPGLLVHNIVDRDTYGYRGFYVDACRGVDVLLGRPEVDGSRIGIQGGSQGGALAIVVSALRPEAITCGVAGVPYLCGLFDAPRLTRSFPYEEINEYLRAHPDHRSAVRHTVAYYDGINFAPMISCPMLVYLGLADDVCPPETGLALYAALACPKELVTTEGSAHDGGSHWVAPRAEAFLARHLRPAPIDNAAAGAGAHQ